MTIALTGLTYADWERQAARLDHVVTQAERTGLLDARHIAELESVEEDIVDELTVIDDVRELSDPATAVQLLPVRRSLAGLRNKLRLNRLRLKSMLRR